mmetsp:Transcript_4741/g.5701  ORF Transcript_4741/g.5701 Transcript_4741/m.5701 type:complete len:81 (-) Transcript_4741:806-1048(-)
MSGLTTTAIPVLQDNNDDESKSGGSWKQTDLPLPVPLITSASRPLWRARMVSSWNGLSDSDDGLFLLLFLPQYRRKQLFA